MTNERGMLLSVKQAAEILNVHPNTMRRYADEGRVRCFRVNGPRRDRRFWREDVERMLLRTREGDNNGRGDNERTKLRG